MIYYFPFRASCDSTKSDAATYHIPYIYNYLYNPSGYGHHASYGGTETELPCLLKTPKPQSPNICFIFFLC